MITAIGGSIGISVVTSVLTRASQRRQVVFAMHLSPTSPTLRERLDLAAAVLAPHLGEPQARRAAYAIVYQTVAQQARLAAFIHDFQVLHRERALHDVVALEVRVGLEAVEPKNFGQFVVRELSPPEQVKSDRLLGFSIEVGRALI